MIEGSCHCGAVRLRVAALPESLTECNCSICARLGVLWAYYPPAQVSIEHAADATAAYVWGDRCIAFHHCRRCGCTTHYTDLDPAIDRMAVNARMLALDTARPLSVRRLDGAGSWEYLQQTGHYPWVVP